MLYERWRQVARAFPEQIALRDLASGRQWTFRELAAETGRGPRDAQKVAFPQGICAGFIFSVLQAWRAGQVVCPLEIGQDTPEFPAALPGEIVHLKATSATAGASK